MIVWTCDFRENSGEGRLARLFLSQTYYSLVEQICLTWVKVYPIKKG